MYASESDVVMFDDFHGAVRQRGHLTLSAATLGHQVEEEALPTGRVTVLRTRLPVFGSHNANPVSAGSSGASTAGAPATKAVLRMGTPSIAQHDKDSVGRVRIVHTAGPSSAVPGGGGPPVFRRHAFSSLPRLVLTPERASTISVALSRERELES